MSFQKRSVMVDVFPEGIEAVNNFHSNCNFRREQFFVMKPLCTLLCKVIFLYLVLIHDDFQNTNEETQILSELNLFLLR